MENKNKRIAKNTLLLYFRMLFLMGISLYTSRVILNALGIVDYGVYNVVGGVVAMFSLISGSLSTAISRFINYEMGKNDKEKLNLIFSTSVSIQIILAIIITILAEIIGLWFLYNKLNIPDERMFAAEWVFHLSILTFIINLISVPYNASIIAHERMSTFAYISIFEAIFKLGIAFAIQLTPSDKLISYAVLMCSVALIIRLIYGTYCKRNFEECKYRLIWEKNLLKQMFGFAGWNFIGVAAVVLREQGGNILLNMFFGPVINAAKAVATQVNTAIGGFVTNFMMAMNPQITKSFASQDYKYMMSLVFRGSRFSFYLLLILSMPILFSTEYILNIWLKNPPGYSVIFVQLTIIITIIESLSHTLITLTQATGKIKKYQIIVGGIQLINLPISYVLFKLTHIPEMIFFVTILLSITCLLARLIMLRRMVQLNIKDFFEKVILSVISVTSLSLVLPCIVKYLIFKNHDGFTTFIITSIICLISCGIIIFYIGCTPNERGFIIKRITAIKIKSNHKS